MSSHGRNSRYKGSTGTTVNWWYNYDGRLESNQVGTHEFIEFCRLVGAKPYFAANATSTTPLEVRNWIEYCNFPQGSTSLAKEREKNGHAEPYHIEYWGIGNENWGGGGNMIPEDYAAAYRKYAMAAQSAGKGCQFVACGPNGNDLEWTRKFFKKYFDQDVNAGVYGNKLDAYSMHYYCGTAGTATEFSQEEWYEVLERAAFMEDILVNQRKILDTYDPERKIGAYFQPSTPENSSPWLHSQTQ